MWISVDLFAASVIFSEMNCFAPLFSKIVDSSLWSEPDYVCKVFVTLLAIKDSDHVARINAFHIGRKCWPLEPEHAEQRALEALKILMSPDTKRIEPQPFDGRRIERTDDGYLVLNGQAYEDLMRDVSRRVYKARKEREYREKKRESLLAKHKLRRNTKQPPEE